MSRPTGPVRELKGRTATYSRLPVGIDGTNDAANVPAQLGKDWDFSENIRGFALFVSTCLLVGARGLLDFECHGRRVPVRRAAERQPGRERDGCDARGAQPLRPRALLEVRARDSLHHRRRLRERGVPREFGCGAGRGSACGLRPRPLRLLCGIGDRRRSQR